MATLSDQRLTLLDLAKRQDPDGKVATIVELLNETNEILDDIMFKNGNIDTGHKTTVRTGLPTPTWRRFNAGVQPTKSKTAQIEFGCGNMEMYSEVDAALARLGGDERSVMLTEDLASLEAMGQELANVIFYGSVATDPAKFNGMAHYYADLTAESSANIIDAGGTGSDNASIYLVGWAPNTAYGLVPKNSTAGMTSTFLGETTKTNSDGSLLQVLRSHHKLEAGLAIEDWRYVVRIANIDRSDLAAQNASAANLPKLMTKAINRIPNLNGVTPVFYMDRLVKEGLEEQISSQTANSTLSYEDVGGRMTSMFKGIPIRRVDALYTNEARVVA